MLKNVQAFNVAGCLAHLEALQRLSRASREAHSAYFLSEESFHVSYPILVATTRLCYRPTSMRVSYGITLVLTICYYPILYRLTWRRSHLRLDNFSRGLFGFSKLLSGQLLIIIVAGCVYRGFQMSFQCSASFSYLNHLSDYPCFLVFIRQVI